MPGLGTAKLAAGTVGIATAENYLHSAAKGDVSAEALGKALADGAVEGVTAGLVDAAAKKVLGARTHAEPKPNSKLQMEPMTEAELESVVGESSDPKWRPGKTSSGINGFSSPSDPIRDILGASLSSNPEEWNSIIKELEDNGVKVIYREGVMGYAPLKKGEPGQLIIDQNASLSALKHERSHFLQAKAQGFPSAAEAYMDWRGRISNELKAYNVEIEEAEKLGLVDVVEQLRKNFEAEKQYIIERYGSVE